MKIKIKDKVYNIEIFEAEEGKVKITVDEKEFVFGEEKETTGVVPAVRTSFLKRDFSKKEIRAPIDGVISEIFIKEDDFIKKGEKLLFLLSMKMENEILSEFEGKVKKVLVKKDQKVKKDDTLIELF